jgi:hypothetical protein
LQSGLGIFICDRVTVGINQKNQPTKNTLSTSYKKSKKKGVKKFAWADKVTTFAPALGIKVH